MPIQYLKEIPDDDAFDATGPFQSAERDIKRWNQEWLRYLGKGWPRYLAHHSDYPETPKLSDDPAGQIKLSLGAHSPLEVYCDRDALTGKRVLELGCGVGLLGKLLARYCDHYLGTDFSPLALQVARLVSPKNTTYAQCADTKALEPFFGTIDTAIGRHFWIHQNLKMGKANLDYYARFLKKGGRAYLDFFRVDEKRPDQDLWILPPTSRFSRSHPSATFQWKREHLDELLKGAPFKFLRDTVHVPMQRWYVVLERT
jgi:SAM-dependent methyltransferase